MPEQKNKLMSTNIKPKIVLGIFEKVDFPDFGVFNINTKIDTGAYTGALHCTNIEVKQNKEGAELLFSPFGRKAKTISTTDYYVSRVKSSNGINEKRYFISTKIILKDVEYPITLSITDRKGMKYPVLIGRRFLQKNHLLVDPRRYSK